MINLILPIAICCLTILRPINYLEQQLFKNDWIAISINMGIQLFVGLFLLVSHFMLERSVDSILNKLLRLDYICYSVIIGSLIRAIIHGNFWLVIYIISPILFLIFTSFRLCGNKALGKFESGVDKREMKEK